VLAISEFTDLCLVVSTTDTLYMPQTCI